MATPRKPKDQHKKRGRPSLYKPEYIETAIRHGQDGNPWETLGAVIGVCTDTLNEWCDVHPEFSAAKKMSRVFALKWWFEKGKDNLIMHEGEKFNASVYIFTMKAMFQLRDGSESKAQLENPNGQPKDSEQVKALQKEIEELRGAMDVRSLKVVS